MDYRGDGSGLQIRAGPAILRYGGGNGKIHYAADVMRVSRRIFLGAVGSVVLVRGGVKSAPRCVVLDLGCVLDESLAGFRGQVEDLPYGDGDGDVVIVPGVGS